MRVSSDVRQLSATPGSSTSFVVDVVNNATVIDGVTATVRGLPEYCVTVEPRLLPLFPDAQGRLTLTVAVPPDLPAGRHPLTVEVLSHGALGTPGHVDLDLDVASRPALSTSTRPRLVRARRSGRFVLELANRGNVALDVAIQATDVDRAVHTEIQPPSLRLPAGGSAAVLLHVRGPRMISGGELDRTVSIETLARPVPILVPESSDAVPTDEPLQQETTVRLRQRPLLSRGLLTAAILAGIVALWASVFLLGLSKVFGGDPMTKQAPASFFLAAGGTSGAQGFARTAADVTAPAGALPKSGQLPPGVGGSISGTVSARTDGQPVGRILVQAWRVGLQGPVLVSSAATQSDGTYTVAGLFPTSYYVEFSAPGYHTVWFPSAPAMSGGTQVPTLAQGTTSGINAVVTGQPASISGKVNPGDTLTPTVTTVTARPLLGAGSSKPTATTQTAADGSYHLANLPAPATYELTFTTAGYQTSTLVDQVVGGDSRLEPTITLGASSGQILGSVTADGVPLGGATVSTTVNGTPITVATPTTGQVGAYVLGNLPTPGTYVITYSAPGHGSATKIVDVSAGQSVVSENVDLANGTGSITGRLVNSAGAGIGGATVTVGGATTTGGSATAVLPSTTTLTAGTVGAFALNGLAAPGSYTLTFTLPGYAPATIPVTLTSNGAPPNVTVTLTVQLGGITGSVSVRNLGNGTTSSYAGATITATNGQQTWTVASSGPGGALPNGGYLITGLRPGTYSVTVSAAGLDQQTGMVTVSAGARATLNLTLTEPAG